MGGPGSGRSMQPRNIASELKVVRLREQGLTLADIGRRLGISGSSSGRVLSRQGRADLLGRRGFAALTAERRRELSSKGGKAAHAAGTAHQFTTEEAVAAGAKGGKAAHARGTAHTFTVEEARLAGRKGGVAGRGTAAGAKPARVAEAAASGHSDGRGRVTPATLARRAKMAELWAAGLPLREIGERFGVTRQTVAAALRAVRDGDE